MTERRRDQGSGLSEEEFGLLQMAEGIRGIMKVKKMDIEGNMNLSIVNLRKPIETVNLYIQNGLQHGINTFFLIF